MRHTDNVDRLKCTACDKTFREHSSEGKCLFEASSFTCHEEKFRDALRSDLALSGGDRAVLEEQWGQLWEPFELQQHFKVHGFLAPFVEVTRLADGQRGSLLFQHYPRYYFDFRPD